MKPVEVQTKSVERTKLNIDTPPPITAREIKWIIITPNNADQVFSKLREENTDVVLFAITDTGYEQLALTMAEIRNYIATQKSIILKYKDYYEPNNPVEKK